MSGGRGVWGWGLALLLVLLVSCTTPATEVLVVLDTDMDYGPAATLRSVVLTVRSNGPDDMIRTRQVLQVGTSTGLVALPASLGVLPRDGDTEHVVWIEAIGCGANGCAGVNGAGAPLVTQRAVVGFVPGETLVLRLMLARSCEGRTCVDQQQTCSTLTRECVDARIDERTLPRLSSAGDAGVPDRRLDVVMDDMPDVSADVSADAGADAGTDVNV